jgi:hypothetical protein
MAIDLFSGAANSPISADLMYKFYDNKAITPQIRTALQKKENDFLKENGNSDTSSSASKAGPAARVSITDQIIRMNIANNSKKTEKEGEKETSDTKKPYRYDVLAEVKKSVAEREAAAKKEKDAQLQEIKDKIAAEEAAKKEEEGKIT